MKVKPGSYRGITKPGGFICLWTDVSRELNVLMSFVDGEKSSTREGNASPSPLEVTEI